MQKKIIEEGKAKLYTVEGKLTKNLKVFYNPIMKLNRDLSLLILRTINKQKLRIGLPMAASGIRGIRVLIELNKPAVVHFNDKSKHAVGFIRQNLKLNNIKDSYTISQKDASVFMLEASGFHYIDIDPFGSPNPFLDAAVKRISRNGILAVTATDTAPLAGTYPRVCQRKYWALPLRNEFMHETALRILIRKVQLVGMQFDKALLVLFSYYANHYYRVFFRAVKSKSECDKLLANFGFVSYCYNCLRRYIGNVRVKCGCGNKLTIAGPLYLGSLWDKRYFNAIKGVSDYPEASKLLSVISKESEIGSPFFYTLGSLGKLIKLKQLPKLSELIGSVKAKGYKAARTHFANDGLRTNMPYNLLTKVIKKWRS